MSSPEQKNRPGSVIKREQVRLDEPGPAREPRAPARAASCGSAPARVRLIQIEGRTQAIEFTCRCGEVSLLELQYEKTP